MELRDGIDLVMELVCGGDLYSHMQAGMVDDESSAKFIIWQICDALSVRLRRTLSILLTNGEMLVHA